MTGFDEVYEDLVKGFYANASFDEHELKCWVRGTMFTISSDHVAIILKINSPILGRPPIYNELLPEIELLKESLGENLKVSPAGTSVNTINFSFELKILTMIMFNNLYPLSNTTYINLSRVMFLCDLMNDVEIYICHHISTYWSRQHQE